MKKIGLMLWRQLRAAYHVIAILLPLVWVLWFFYNQRPVPGNTQTTLFTGVTYKRIVYSKPRQLLVHVVTVDLDVPGIGFLVTPGDPSLEYPLNARYTTEFLKEFDLQIAINGDFFRPFAAKNIWNYYPHTGDPIQAFGFVSSQGVVYSAGHETRPTLYLSADNQASFERPIGEVYNAISGRPMILKNALVLTYTSSYGYPRQLHPRTAVALDQSGQQLMIFVVDGRQPNYSAGVTLAELAEIALEHGGYNALNLDGGGSTALVIEDKSGGALLLNSPINNRIPGRERVVGNHLGILILDADENK